MTAHPTAARLVQLVAIIPMLGGLTVAGAAVKLGPAVLNCAQAATTHHATLVVQHGDGAVITLCVAFTEDSITGDQLLSDAHAQAQLEYATAGYGGGNGEAVCQIDDEPAQYPPGCWTASSPYWALFVSRGDGPWSESSLGVSSQTFRDGDAEGFRYEAQSDNSAPPSPRGVCPPPTSPSAAPAQWATPTAHRPATAATPRPSRAPASASPVAGAGTSVVVSAPPGASGNNAIGVEGARDEANVQVANRSGTLPAGGAGVWAAGGLATALLLALMAQLLRTRRRVEQRPPP